LNDENTLPDGKLYAIDGARVTLSPEARALCKLHNMSEAAMARHLLDRHKLAQQNLIQRDSKEFV
jgi:hypothetical protein